MNEDELLAAALELLQRRAARRSEPSLTVRQLFAAYEAANKTARSWPIVLPRLLPFINGHAERNADGISVLDWTKHAQKRRETPLPSTHSKTGKCYGENTISNELSCVKTMFNFGVIQGLLRFNPIAAAKRLKKTRRRETAPKEWEIGRALAACATPEQTVVVLCASDAGMRRGEILALRHDWIDYERKTITLPGYACKNRRGGTIPATQRLLDAIVALPRHIRHPYVLVSEKGDGPYSRFAIDRWWRDICDRAGIEAAPGDGTVHLHDCRAAAATNALARGVKLETVSRRILRHANLSTTQIYIRGEVGNLEEAIEAMEAGILRDQRRGPRSTVPAPEPRKEIFSDGD